MKKAKYVHCKNCGRLIPGNKVSYKFLCIDCFMIFFNGLSGKARQVILLDLFK